MTISITISITNDMANYANLKSAIQQVVKTNGNNEITGALLQQSLVAMINSLGGYYQFAGIATPSTNPGTPDQNVFYLASTAGTYSNFGSIVIAENEAAILKYNGTWSKESSGFATSEKVSQLESKVTELEDEFELLNIDVVGDGSNLQVGRILSGGVYVNYTNYRYQLFEAKKGDIVNYNGYADTGTVVFGMQNPGATTFTSIEKGHGDEATIGTYTIPENGTYGICGYRNATIAVTIIRNGRVLSLEESVSELAETVSGMETTVADNTNEIEKIEQVVKNILVEKREDATITSGGYVYYADGSISQNTGWSYATLNVEAGQEYTIDSVAGQLARLWIIKDQNNNIIQYSLDSTTIALKSETIVIPENGVVLIVNARKASGDPLPSIKLHEMAVDGERVLINGQDIKTYIDSLLTGSDNVVNLNFTPNEQSYILSPFNDTYNIKTRFVLSRNAPLVENQNFNILGVSLINKITGNESVVHACNDDICPGNYNSIYIGGNHADSDVHEVVCAGHGKTYADIGSVWQAGNRQFTIVAIIDSNTLWMLSDNISTYPYFRFSGPSENTTLTHISGATHTDSFTITASTAKQWHSATLVADLSVYLDGKKITESGIYSFKKLSICENYDVLNPASVLELLKARVGTFTENPNPNIFTTADKVVRHSIVYGFRNAAEWTIATDFIAYQDIHIGYFGYTQMYYLSGSNRKLYMPKALPNGGKDFRTIENYTSLSSALKFTSEYWENPELPPDRFLQFTDSIGVHTGYIFDYGVGGANRKNYVNNAITLNNTLKIYPHGIDDKISVSAGDTFSAVVWRTYIDRAKINIGGVIATNAVEYAGNCYVYADFNSTGIYGVEIPGDFVGRDFSIFEKSDNITILSKLSNGNVLVKVDNTTPMYGYLVLKIQ